MLILMLRFGPCSLYVHVHIRHGDKHEHHEYENENEEYRIVAWVQKHFILRTDRNMLYKMNQIELLDW